MKRNLWPLLVFVWVLSAGLTFAADRWVHVKVVERGDDGDRVRVNIPLSLAEKILPTIKADNLHDGLIKVSEYTSDKVDLHQLLEAVRDAQDNDYVTVDSKKGAVRVAKSGGFLLIKVHESRGNHAKPSSHSETQNDSTVDIKVPFTVVDALLSGKKDELNLLAAIRTLGNSPDIDLVTVNDADSSVRIWVDSKNVAD